MGRLASAEKGQFYPTPLPIVDEISRHISLEDLKPQRGGILRIFDPSAGDGKALARFAENLRKRYDLPMETWGVEVSPARAAQASEVLDIVVEAPIEVAGFRPGDKTPASVIFGNPPYDISDAQADDYGYRTTATRLELDHLRLVTHWLAPGGTLIWIIPYRALDFDMGEWLDSWYHNVIFRRFPDPSNVRPREESFDIFGQVVILAMKNVEKQRYDWNTVNGWQQSHGVRSSKNDVRLDTVALGSDGILPEYRAPLVPSRVTLKRLGFTQEEQIQAASENMLAWSDLAQQILPAHMDMDEPVLPPNVGHIAQMVAGGLIGMINTDDELFKGRAVKSRKVIPDPEKKGQWSEKDVWETHIVSVTKAGLLHLMRPDLVAGFLRKHAEIFKEYISKNFPAYGDSSTPEENAILDTLSLDKRLPGVEKPGLTPAQRRWAVALTRSVERFGVGHMVAEMGAGKTRTSAAAVDLMDAYPVAITCPPHMVEKWKDEFEASVPGSKAVIVEHLDELNRVVELYRNGTLPHKLVVILSRSRIKMGPGWEAAYQTRTIIRKLRHPVYKTATAVDRQGKALGWREASEYDYHRFPGPKEVTRYLVQKEPVCPTCGVPLADQLKALYTEVPSMLAKQPLKCQAPRRVWNGEKWEVKKELPCNSPLWQFNPGGQRWPLAKYIKDKLPGFFQCFITDEVHQFKAKGSDQAWAFGVLCKAIPRVITLTGTFFGGYSTSIFYLLFRTQNNIHRMFDWDGGHKWAEQFGVLETTFKTKDGSDFSVNTARERRKLNTKERPGLAPAAVQFFLSTAIFGRLKELGIPLPPYREEVRLVQMSGPQAADYKAMWGFTWDKMLEWRPRYTSSWLQWALARANSCFREELVECRYDDDEILLPAVVEGEELLPKEQALVELVQSELGKHRKVVVYIRQTGTRDIRNRIRDVLERAGVRGITILNENVTPRKREAWLKQNAGNVLITNPKLVETGLDLVQYSTIVFYEVEYSLYTLWQSMRRVWRPGQTKPVKVVWMIYRGTLEEKAMKLIGQKLKAGQLVHGDDVTSALVEDEGSSLVEELIEAIKDEEDLAVDDDTFQLFGDEDGELISESPLGSITHRVAEISSFDEFLAKHGVSKDDIGRRRRKGDEVPKSQLSLF